MNIRATALQAAENNLKQLMADVSRAMEKAEQAIAKLGSNAPGAAAETQTTTSSR
jgi:hypothetical protein